MMALTLEVVGMDVYCTMEDLLSEPCPSSLSKCTGVEGSRIVGVTVNRILAE